jgi:hypothetical protein
VPPSVFPNTIFFDGSRPNTWRWQPFVMKQISYQKLASFAVIGILMAN